MLRGLHLIYMARDNRPMSARGRATAVLPQIPHPSANPSAVFRLYVAVPAYRSSRAWCHSQLGLQRQSLKDAKRAASILPHSPLPYLRQGTGLSGGAVRLSVQSFMFERGGALCFWPVARRCLLACNLPADRTCACA